ncbi:MAG: J domain-containing protein [Crenarchaeota archaeon]|nr:J domain-containing protein [Thermoproteota archaeon]
MTREESLRERALEVFNLRFLDEADVKASFRRRTLSFHPDRHPEIKKDSKKLGSFEMKMMVLNQAYELLQDVLNKRQIDLAKYSLLEDTVLVQSLLPDYVKPTELGKTEQELWIEKFKDRF